MSIILGSTTFSDGGSCTFNGETVNEIKFGDTTVWKAETHFEDVALATLYAYGGAGTKTKISEVDYDVSAFNTLTFSYSSPCTMSWSNSAGNSYTCKVYVDFNGTSVMVAQKSGTLYSAGSTRQFSGTAEINLGDYTTSQKESVNFKVTLKVEGDTEKRIYTTLAVSDITAK